MSILQVSLSILSDKTAICMKQNLSHIFINERSLVQVVTKHPSYQIRYADKGNNYMTIWNTKRWGNRYLHNNRHNVGVKLEESQLFYISQALLFIYQP